MIGVALVFLSAGLLFILGISFPILVARIESMSHIYDKKLDIYITRNIRIEDVKKHIEDVEQLGNIKIVKRFKELLFCLELTRVVQMGLFLGFLLAFLGI